VPVIVSPIIIRTLGDLKSRIADELARADLTSQIALAISQAIEEGCTHRFWFMETRGVTVSLSAGTSAYVSTDLSNLIEIDRLVLITGSQRRTLREMSDDELDRLNDGTPPQGEPYAYSRYGDELRVYPVPTQSYTVLIDGLTKGAALNSDSDTNIWTDSSKGERYIRALAKRQLYADVIRDTDKALLNDELAKRYRQELFAQTHSRIASNEMAAYA
jgi:hypothetical protein